MNVAVITGRLNADPEISRTKGKGGEDLTVCRYTLIQSDSSEQGWKDNINIIPCVCFGKTAQIAGQQLKQGKLVTVYGRFHGKTIEKDGSKVFFSNIVVDRQVFGR